MLENKLIRKFSRIILALLLRKGIKIDIGKRYPVRMCVDFIGYENFGRRYISTFDQHFLNSLYSHHRILIPGNGKESLNRKDPDLRK